MKKMMKAIIYTSNSGFTKKYAEMLGKELNISVYEIKDIKKKIKQEDPIIYMGWVMGGQIKDYKKVINKYNVKAVCAVGMSVPNEKQNTEIKKKYELNNEYFYLQGGFDKTKLRGIYKFMMNIMEKMVRPQLESKENKTIEEIEMLEMMNEGKDCVKKENLSEIINWLKEIK